MNNNLKRPILSIVIPTKNRSEYAIKSIESCLRIKEKEFELIVEDNSNNDDLEKRISKLDDDRLCYKHNNLPIDMNSNFENAVERAKGDYVTIIGDDDSVSNEIVRIAKWCKEKDIDSLITSRPSSYTWPDSTSQKLGNLMTGKLVIKHFSGKVEYPDVRANLIRCLRSGVSSYYSIPRLYYGIVKIEALRKLKEEIGCLFPGPSPDMANAIALCFVIKKLCWIDYPIFIPGVGRKSGAGLGAQNKHTGKLDQWSHLSKIYINNWSSLIPKIFGGQTIWAEDAIQALKKVGHEEYLKYLNMESVYARSYIKHKRFRKEIKGCLNEIEKFSMYSFFAELLKFTLFRFLSLCNNIYLYKIKPSNLLIISNIDDINEASIIHDNKCKALILPN